MSEFINRRLEALASLFFDLDCERENLIYKLDDLNERIMDIKSSIQFSTGYPDTRVVINIAEELVLEVSPMDISVYTNDQFEKAFPEEACE